MDALVKQSFIKNELLAEAERYDKTQLAALSRQLSFHTGNIVSRRKFSVSSDNSLDGKLSFSHTPYQRFLDMSRRVRIKETRKITRGKNKGKTHRVSRPGTRKIRGFGIHNRFVFGHYTSLVNRLTYGLTNEVAEAIKQKLSDR